MKNLFLWGWIVEDCREAINRLVREGQVKVRFWLADSEKAPNPYTEFLYSQPDFGRFPSLADFPLLSDPALVKFLEMFSREKRAQGLTFHEQAHVAKSYFRYCQHILTSKNIDHVLFELVPLTGLDYICYVAAKSLGIRTTLCYQSNFPGRFFYCHTLEDFGQFLEVPTKAVESPPDIKWGYAKDLHYMKDNRYVSRFGGPWARLIKETFRYGWRKSKKPVRMSGVVQSFVQGLDYTVAYKQMAVNPTSENLSRPFVYFPLHLQPEMSTTGLGGEFGDQLDAIEELLKILPSDWSIYVKENPYQGCEQRGIEFYNRFKTFPRVLYISKYVNTYDLMSKCKFVATVTGTAGWEALTGGKPCLVFGLAWYSSMPGAIRYREGLTVETILNTPLIRDDQMKQYKVIYGKTRAGILDPGYIEIYPEYTTSDNVDKIANFLNEVVVKQPC